MKGIGSKNVGPLTALSPRGNDMSCVHFNSTSGLCACVLKEDGDSREGGFI